MTDMSKMFWGCNRLTDLSPLVSWNTGKVTKMGHMFRECSSLTNASGINDWDIQNVTDFNSMFYGCPTHPEFTKRAGTWSGSTFTPAA